KDISSSLGITALDYIKYMFCGQVHPLCSKQDEETKDDLKALYNAVKDYENGIGYGVNIGMEGRYFGNTGHSVWGISTIEKTDSVDILVYDSNHPNEERYLTLNKNETGEFTSWSYQLFDGVLGVGKTVWGTGKKNSSISFNTYSEVIYTVLPTLISNYTGNKQKISSNSFSYEIDKNLIATKGNIEIINDAIEIKLYGVTENTDVQGDPEDEKYCTEKENLYWVEKGEVTFKTSEIGDQEISLISQNNTKISVKNCVGTICCDSDEQKIIAELSNENNREISMAFSCNNDLDNSIIDMTVSGTASSDTVTATQTETGLVVTGISDGTVTLSKDDEVIETQEISNATSDIEITYDKTGENDDVSLDYEHNHTDSDADGKCDICGETLDAVKNCTHLCHKTGFLGFIWKIINIFNKLFKINPVCSCGMKHY
ncbi:MAG: hypothetical protein ACI4RU_00925, partial [Acutalibacteraceae bacterium]